VPLRIGDVTVRAEGLVSLSEGEHIRVDCCLPGAPAVGEADISRGAAMPGRPGTERAERGACGLLSTRTGPRNLKGLLEPTCISSHGSCLNLVCTDGLTCPR
jgi:hypothetical protein